MKKILSLIDRFAKQSQPEIQEAPRFEEWFNQMYPRDTYNPAMDEFRKTILSFKEDQKRKLTQRNGHSQSF
jgi:hypothetical protein